MVGSAIMRKLSAEGYHHVITRSSAQMDLRDQGTVNNFFETEKPEYVFLAAARVGGIMANSTYRGEFIYDNLMIEANVINTAYKNNVKKLLFLGSSCIYPKLAPQPLKEEYLLTGKLEESNEAYAIAKIAGIKLCQFYREQYGCNYIAAMPTNLYGPNDSYDMQNSHVLPALIRKFHEAKANNDPAVTLWGTGTPKREFLHVDDAASACFFLMQEYDEKEFVNIGVGKDMTIKELAELVISIVGYEGEINWDTSRPDGTPRKLLDVTKIHGLGWHHKIELEDGIKSTYKNYVEY